MFLQEFGEHPNIIRLFNVLKAENDKDIYLVFEHMGENCVCILTTMLFLLKLQYIAYIGIR